MFKNIGKKIKNLAAVVCWIGFIGSAVGAIISWAAMRYADDWWIGFVVLLGGFLVSWIGSLFVYGFGELVDKTCEIEKKLNGCDSTPKIVESRNEQLEKLRQQGLISDEEYEQALAKGAQ